MNWKKGLNFSQKKYKLINENTFVPHFRSNLRAAIPYQILEGFGVFGNGVALLRIKDAKKHFIRIKKLFLEGNSYTICLKAEKFFKKPQIEVIDIKTEEDALLRSINNPFSIKNFIPEFTSSNKSSTPIYVFGFGSKLVVGGYYKKDLLVRDELDLDEASLSALGLYFAEGGKIAASFTNSWPQAINSILDFVENMFNLQREKIKASICCGYSLKNKQKKLEKFWKTETGITNFSRTLHFNKNSTSLQGTLELYFCREVIKDIFVNILNKILDYEINRIAFLRGVFSGDASPIKQTKYSITHHISFDKKEEMFYLKLFEKFFPDVVVRAIGNKFTIYTSWEENKKLLFEDIYKFNPLNRAKFARQFFSLPRTQKNLNIDKQLLEFKRTKYPKIIKDLINNYQKLADLGIWNQNFINQEKERWIK